MQQWVNYLIDNPLIFGIILLVVLVGAVASIISLFKSGGGENSGRGDYHGRHSAKRVYFQIIVSKIPKYAGISENLKSFFQSFIVPTIKEHAKSEVDRLREADFVCLEIVTGDVAPAKADVLLTVKVNYKGNDVYLQVTPLDKRSGGREIDVSVPTEIKVFGTSVEALNKEKVINRIITIVTDAVKGKPVSSLGDLLKKTR